MGEGMLQMCCMLITLIDALASDWSVDLPSSPICAVVGSTLVIPCSYDYPHWKTKEVLPLHSAMEGGGGGGIEEEEEYKVLSEMWCQGESRCLTQSYVFHSAGIFPDPSFQNRVQYLGKPGYQNCSLKISGLKDSDSGTYVFYLITSHPTQKMPEQSGIQLLVADPPRNTTVSVIPNEELPEGVAAALTCRSDANPPVHTYTWYKGPRCVTTPNIHQTQSLDPPCGTGQKLTITDISKAGPGQYCCVANNRHGSQNFTVTVNIDTAQSSATGDQFGRRMVIVGVTITALVVLSGIVAFIIYRKRKSTSSNTSYALTETTSPDP